VFARLDRREALPKELGEVPEVGRRRRRQRSWALAAAAAAAAASAARRRCGIAARLELAGLCGQRGVENLLFGAVKPASAMPSTVTPSLLVFRGP